MKTIQELLNRQETVNREMQTANEEQYSSLEREYESNKREIELLNQKAIASKNVVSEDMSIVKSIREAINNGTRKFTINGGCQRSGEITVSTSHDAISKDNKGLLEPLYANSVLAKAGAKFYTQLPGGDINIPVMSAGTCGWATEIAEAGAAGQTFSAVTLQPKRLTAYIDISRELINQASFGAEEAIRRDLVNAITNKLESTVLGSAAGDTTKPAGMFNGQTLADATTWANVTKVEATVEDNNVYGNLSYILSTGAKADLRAMNMGARSSRLAYDNGDVDGVPAYTTSNVATAGAYIYGDFSNLAIGSWGNIDVTVDEYSQAINGCVRLVVNAYFDAKVLRSGAFAYGKTRA